MRLIEEKYGKFSDYKTGSTTKSDIYKDLERMLGVEKTELEMTIDGLHHIMNRKEARNSAIGLGVAYEIFDDLKPYSDFASFLYKN